MIKPASIPIRHIILQENALAKLTEIVAESGFLKPFFLFDRTTYAIAGDLIEAQLLQANTAYRFYIIPEDEPTPDEAAVGKVLIHMPHDCDLMIGVGSGTINDLSRYISFKLHLPYMILATAPSMDGFASGVAPLIVDHMKTTYEAQAPYAILGDLNLIKAAPVNMIAAGVGDILGKHTCLCDWAISSLITGEYHSKDIEDMVRQSIAAVTANIEQARDREPGAIQSIMEALILSGIAMSLAGNSRPASGSEHHLSHYWEMMYLFDRKKPVLHGTKVGIAAIAILHAYELLFKMEIDFEQARKNALNYSSAVWEESMRTAYKKAAPSVIALEKELHKNSPENVLQRIDRLEAHWSECKELAAALPAAEYIRELLLILSAPVSPAEVGIDKATFINSFLAAKELRNRFGLLQILFDLGLAEEIAEQIWSLY